MKLGHIFMLLVSCSHAEQLKDSSYWDFQLTKTYIHNSEMQRRWAMAFIAPHLKKLNGNEHILDIRCGDGKITADISKFVPEGKVHGIDISGDMILWAQKQYHSCVS
jgi:ubiquinone/menaquinone biosynthesis C-methylase UbiE